MARLTSPSSISSRCAPFPASWCFVPADANEVIEAWRVIMQLKQEPAVLVLTRQALPTIDRSKYAAASGVAKGAYILADAPDGKPEAFSGHRQRSFALPRGL